MNKNVRTLILIGAILIGIGIIFCIKNKVIDKNIEICVLNNSTTYKNNRTVANKGKKGKINIKMNVDKAGFYRIDFINLQEGFNIYSDSEYNNKISSIYKIYNDSIRDEFSVYYKNDGDKYNVDIKVEVKYSENVETMTNLAHTKEYIWSDEYRPYIESITFEKNNDFICEDLCFDISNKIGKVYAKLIKKENNYDLKIISDTEIYLPIDSSYLFSDFTNLKNIEFSNINTNYLENVSYMFAQDPKLEKLDLSIFNTLKIKNMDYMFMNSSMLKEIDLSTFTFDDKTTDNLFMNIKEDSIIYVKSSIEQAWIFGPNNTNRPQSWKARNVLIK